MAPPASRALSLGSRASVLWPAESSDPPASLKDKNREASETARVLLERFPAEVQHAATKLQLEYSERMWMDSGRHREGPHSQPSRQQGGGRGSHERLAASKALGEEENGTLAKEVESLSRLLAEGTGGEELAGGAGGGSEGGNKRRKASVARGVEEGGRERQRRGEARVEADESRIDSCTVEWVWSEPFIE